MTEQRTVKPYQKAFLWGGIWLTMLTTVVSMSYGYFSAQGFGRFTALTMIPSAIVGFLASRSKTPWGFLKIGVIYFITLMILILIQVLGKLQSMKV